VVKRKQVRLVSPDRKEKDIQKDICRFLDMRHLVYSPTNSKMWPNGRGGFLRSGGTVGWPDITGLLPYGRLFCIEVKGKHGQVSPIQRKVMDQIAASNGIVGVARCVDDAARIIDPWIVQISSVGT
jgi:hypothetical protein